MVSKWVITLDTKDPKVRTNVHRALLDASLKIPLNSKMKIEPFNDGSVEPPTIGCDCETFK